MLNETTKVVLDLGHEFRLHVLVQVVLETSHFDDGVELAARLLLIDKRLGDGDLNVDLFDFEVGRTSAHSLAGGFDDEVRGPFQVGKSQVVAHAVSVVEIAVECDRSQHRFGLCCVLESNVGHLHGEIVFLPSHVVQFAAVLGVVGPHWLADFVFHFGNHTFVGGLQHFVGNNVSQNVQVSVFQSAVKSLSYCAVFGLDVGVGVLVLGGSDYVVLTVESGRHVAAHFVQYNGEVAQFSVMDVGLERTGCLDLIEFVLDQHDVFFRVDVHVFDVTVVEVLHGRVVEGHEVLFGQLDDVFVDGQHVFQIVGVLSDVVLEGDIVEGSDFLDHFFGESGGRVDRHLVFVSVSLFV